MALGEITEMATSTSSPSTPASTRSEEPDAELTELVESLQKIQAVQRPQSQSDGPAFERTFQYVSNEVESLRTKQASIQEQIDKKNREVVSLRETLLVVNGALQGLQHIYKFMSQGGSPDASSSLEAGSGP